MAAQKMDTEIRQEQIAQAALDLVESQGIQALSIAKVAARVGLVPSGIYRHFKSKDDILDATLDLIAKRLLENLENVRRQSSDALERLRLLLRGEIRLLLKQQAIPHIILSESIFTDSPQRKVKVRSLITHYFKEIEAIVEEGQAAGSLRADSDPLSVVLMFKGMLLPAIVLWRVTEGELDLARQAEAAWELFQRAVANPG